MTEGERVPRQSGGRRVRFALAAALVGVYLAFALVSAINTHRRIGLGGAPLFYDFSALYQAGAFADAGHAAAAYDDNVIIAAERAAFPGTTARLPWNYPPTFQLVFMPLAALPYVLAWGQRGREQSTDHMRCWRGAWSERGNPWLLLLAPAAAVNLFVGQNGLLSAVLIGGGVLMLRSRPNLGRRVLGMMAYKPQFAVLVPIVLCLPAENGAPLVRRLSRGLCWRWWRQPCLGSRLGSPFCIPSSPSHRRFFRRGSSSDWRSIPSVMIMARAWGLDARLSSVCRWGVAAAAVVGVA